MVVQAPPDIRLYRPSFGLMRVSNYLNIDARLGIGELHSGNTAAYQLDIKTAYIGWGHGIRISNGDPAKEILFAVSSAGAILLKANSISPSATNIFEARTNDDNAQFRITGDGFVSAIGAMQAPNMSYSIFNSSAIAVSGLNSTTIIPTWSTDYGDTSIYRHRTGNHYLRISGIESVV
jgi:hypothetical protein